MAQTETQRAAGHCRHQGGSLGWAGSGATQLLVLNGLIILPGSAWNTRTEGAQQLLSQHLLQEICPPRAGQVGETHHGASVGPGAARTPQLLAPKPWGCLPARGGLTHALGEINKHTQKKAHPSSSSMNHGSACLSNALFCTESVLLCRLTRAEIKSDGPQNATALRNYKAVLL